MPRRYIRSNLSKRSDSEGVFTLHASRLLATALSDMALIYALVARGADHVLAEYTSSGLSGNFNTVALLLLRKISSQDSNMSYVYDR